MLKSLALKELLAYRAYRQAEPTGADRYSPASTTRARPCRGSEVACRAQTGIAQLPATLQTSQQDVRRW